MADKKKTTLKDVARQAGVSVATVSYILNNRTDQKISEATRKKVLQIANLLDYTPNFAAKSLATGRSNIIGVSYHLNENTPSRNLEITGFVNLLIERLNRLKYDVLFMPLRASEDNISPNRNIDGIITIDLSHRDFIELADNYYVPIINVDMLVNDLLFYQIYSDIPSLINEAQKYVGDDFYLLLDGYANENYLEFVTGNVAKDRVLIFPECNSGILDSLHDKKAVVIGSYLALIARAYLKDSNMAVISSNETSHILPESVHVIRNDYSKKANLVISIMMNALDKKFDVTHDHKV